jgi:hypothetical protein
MTTYNNRVSSIHHIYRPGVYKMELGFGRLEGQPDFTSPIDKMKEEAKLQALEDASKVVELEVNAIREALKKTVIGLAKTESEIAKEALEKLGAGTVILKNVVKPFSLLMPRMPTILPPNPFKKEDTNETK